MNRSELYKNVKEKIDDAIKELNKLQAKIESNNKQINSNVYKPEYIRELKSNNSSIKYDQSDVMRRALAEVNKLTDEYINGLAYADALRGDKLTDDVKLLTCGVKLTAKDLMGIIERNKGNNTMEQIICRYADENKIEIPFVYVSENLQEKQSAKNISELAEIVMRNHGNNKVYNELMEVFG